MRLDGIPLIVSAAVVTVLVAAATVFGWRRGGRLRLPVRVSGLVAVEVLIALTIGLIVNRNEGFYPSWQALAGGQDNAAVGPPPTGKLDRTLTAGTARPWTPPDAARWRLAGSPVLVVPFSYTLHADRAYPVIVVLTTADRAASVRAQAASTADALTLVAVPTTDTTAADLADLPALLTQDTRAAGTGWAIVADAAHTALARQWHSLAPARFRMVTGSLQTAADRLPPPLTTPVRLPS
jgi:lysyl-tRNA synthetase class 2